MKNEIPIPGTIKAKILHLAVRQFGANGFEGVHVKQLAKDAGVTTGAIYHHFQSKRNLYSIVREEMERRIVDRMEGAAAVFEDPKQAIRSAVLVGFDAAVKFNASRLISEIDPTGGQDRIECFIEKIGEGVFQGISIVLSASYRASLQAVADRRLTVEEARQALKWILNQ